GFHPPAEATSAQLLLQKQFLIQQVEEHRSKLSGLDRQAAQKQAELATIAASQKKLEAILDVVQQRVEIRKVLYDHPTGSKVNYLEILQAQVETEHELAVQRSRSREVEAALAGIAETRAQTAAEFRRALSGELVEAQRKVAGLKEDLVKAEQRTKL